MRTEEEQKVWLEEMLAIFAKRQSDPSCITLVDWDGRPGVLRQATREAFAIVRDDGDWVPVSFSDMFHTGALIDQETYAQIWPFADLLSVPWKQTGRA